VWNPIPYPWCKTKNCWHSVHVHCSEGVVISSLAFLPTKPANTMFMGSCRCTAIRFSKMQDQKLLMLSWRSFVEGGSDIVTSIFTHKGRQYFDYGLMPLHSTFIIQETRPEIVDAPLTLMSRMGQQACRFPFFLIKMPDNFTLEWCNWAALWLPKV